ncbi:MAG: 3-hydroxyacyl-CoA dehydrogenase family protein, partial [Campylobacteraceae bacterium]|nr:3-hydroxyacyl-CoA dehydrogenase family protein [Campylobacteraceae bacterium]
MKQGAVLATNTSGIPMDDLATVLVAPERLVGIHFFNPVAKMKLVETIAGQKTAKETLDIAHSFVTQIRKLPLPVKSSPGFLVNRILMPYLMEAVNMVDEGKQAEAVDKAATDFGMPMGPITLADTVGLDICLAVANDLSD